MKTKGLGKKLQSAKLFLPIVGGLAVVGGITMVLVWWSDVVSLFRGVVGMVLAVAGLLILSQAKE